jgi:hypothetical protein
MANIFNVVIPLSTAIILFISPFIILKRFKFFESLQLAEKLVYSFITGLAGLLLPLHFSKLLGNFTVISIIIYLVSSLIFIFTLLNKIKNIRWKNIQNLTHRVTKISTLDAALIISIAFNIFKYLYFLEIRAIIDWDATSMYLPYARSIVITDSLPLHAFDQMIILKPQGISVLYAWTYIISGSSISESFRIMPLFFNFGILLMIYLIGTHFFCKKIAKIGVMIYTLLPLHDIFLNIWALYPDLPFVTTSLAFFYFSQMATQKLENRNINIIYSGISLGLSALFKSFAVINCLLLPLTLISYSKSKILRLFLPFLVPLSMSPSIAFISNLNMGVLKAIETASLNFIQLFHFSKLTYFSLIIISSFFIAWMNYDKKLEKKSEKSTLNIMKIIAGILIIALPFFLIWYGDNYLKTGTLLNRWNINENDMKWAGAILKPLLEWGNNSNPALTTDYYLSSFLLPFSAPLLGTFFFVPKIIGIVKSAQKKKVRPVFNLTFGFFTLWFVYLLFPPNERWLLFFAPLLSIFSAVGFVYCVERIENIFSETFTLLSVLILGSVSLVQSHLLLTFKDYENPYTIFSQKISQIFSIEWNYLVGPNEATNLYSTFQLLLVGLLLFILILAIMKVIFFTGSKLLNRKTHLGIFNKKNVINILLIIITATITFLPTYTITYFATDGNINNFHYSHREHFGWNELYSKILPHIISNYSRGDTILSFRSHFTGLQYYLGTEVILLDLSIMDNLALVRKLIEGNSSSVLETINNHKIKYVLLPNPEYDSIVSDFLVSTELIYKIQSVFQLTVKLRISRWILYEID